MRAKKLAYRRMVRAESFSFVDMGMQMPVAWLRAMGMFLIFQCDGNCDQASMTHAPLRDDVVGEVLNLWYFPSQHSHLHAALVIEVNMHCRERKVMVLVERSREALRKVARLMIIDIDERRYALLRRAGLLGRLSDAGAGEIADRFRSVLVAADGDHAVELSHKLVVEGDGYALHWRSSWNQIVPWYEVSI
jgi:hypothetical protein